MNTSPDGELDFSPAEEMPALSSSTGDGSGTRRPTTVGYSGDGYGFGGGGCGSDCPGHGNQSPVPHQKLKDLAISALEQCLTKDYTNVNSTLTKLLIQQSINVDEMASVLSSLVVTAYTIAASAPSGEAMSILCSAFPNFTHVQLHRIACIAY